MEINKYCNKSLAGTKSYSAYLEEILKKYLKEPRRQEDMVCMFVFISIIQ